MYVVALYFSYARHFWSPWTLYQACINDLDDVILWYIVLKCLWTCVSDFVSINHSSTVPSLVGAWHLSWWFTTRMQCNGKQGVLPSTRKFETFWVSLADDGYSMCLMSFYKVSTHECNCKDNLWTPCRLVLFEWAAGLGYNYIALSYCGLKYELYLPHFLRYKFKIRMNIFLPFTHVRSFQTASLHTRCFASYISL